MEEDNKDNGISEEVSFSDDKGFIYPTYFSLDKLKLDTAADGLMEKTLSIGSRLFPVKDNLSSFQEEGKDVYLNLNKLLGFEDTHLTSQVLSLILISPNGKKEETKLVYLSRYILMKDPRKEENKGHMSLLLDSLTLDFPYQREEKKSNLQIKIDGKPLFLLLANNDAVKKAA
ncbi:MAG: hypothetical protein WCR16_01360 [Bacilli bacterium]